MYDDTEELIVREYVCSKQATTISLYESEWWAFDSICRVYRFRPEDIIDQTRSLSATESDMLSRLRSFIIQFYEEEVTRIPEERGFGTRTQMPGGA